MNFMKNFISILKQTKMFTGIDDDEIKGMLSCLNAHLQKYKKGEYILRQGESVNYIAVLAEGSLYIQRDDFWGNRTIVNTVAVGEMFGEAYIAPESVASINDVVATEDSAVIFFDARKIINVCSSACEYHSKVIENLFYDICEKNIKLVKKIEHISKRTTREKLISYLSEESKEHNSSRFTIPFNRQQLADYLSVERSAMSKELCKMRDDGLIRFEKNNFELL